MNINKRICIKENNRDIDNIFIDKSNDYGIVIESNYNDSIVIYHNELINAKLKNNLICNKIIFPGDKVTIIKEKDIYYINNIIKRTSIISRNKKDNTKISNNTNNKYIAVNIDIGVIVGSCINPPLHSNFIDRYIMLLESNKIDIIICINKCDLKTKYEDKIIKMYRSIGYNVIEVSTYNNTGIDILKDKLRGKQAILVGSSGVGKSSIINKLINNNEIKTNEIGYKSKRGKHTTTKSKYYIWDNNSSIIDTPGIRSLNINNFSLNEVKDNYIDLKEYSSLCKYHNCNHYDEDINTCNIKKEVIRGNININRYKSYIRVLDSILNNNKYDEIIKEIEGEINEYREIL